MRRWLGLLGVGILVLVAGCSGTPPASHEVVNPPRSSGPQVDLNATPPGWVPLDYGDAQISVPSNWVIGTTNCSGPRREGWIDLVGFTRSGYHCPSETPMPVNTLSIGPGPTDTASASSSATAMTVNGFLVYQDEIPGPASGIYSIPPLGSLLSIHGSLANAVLHTLTYSPRAAALSPGPSPTGPDLLASGVFWGTQRRRSKNVARSPRSLMGKLPSHESDAVSGRGVVYDRLRPDLPQLWWVRVPGGERT